MHTNGAGAQQLAAAIVKGLGSEAENLPAFVARFRICALDLVGAGSSAKPAIDYSVPALARFLARFLDGGYNGLANESRRLGIARVYWYTWASSYAAEAGPSIFDYSGLFAWDGTNAPQSRPAYTHYVRDARRYEGCAKTAAGLCKR